MTRPVSSPPASVPLAMPKLSDYYGAVAAQPRAFLREARVAVKAARAAGASPPSFDANDAEETFRRLPELDPLLSRTVKLLNKEPPALRRWVARVTQVAFEASLAGRGYEGEPALARFDRFLRVSADDLLGKDKERRERAQNLLRLSFPWLVERQNLKPEEALPLVGQAKRERAKSLDLRRDLLRLFFRAPPRQLMDLSLVGAWFDAALAEEAKARIGAFHELSRCREELDRQAGDLDRVRAELRDATAERDRLARSLDETEKRLRDQQNLRELDRKQIIGRFRAFLSERISLHISDARDAMDFDPPEISAARERLDIASAAIASELEKD